MLGAHNTLATHPPLLSPETKRLPTSPSSRGWHPPGPRRCHLTIRPSPIGPCRPLSSPGMATPANAALSLFLLDSLSRKLLPASRAEPRIPPQILSGAWPLLARSSHFQALLPGAAPRVQLQAGSWPARGLTQVQPLVPHPCPAAPPPAPNLAGHDSAPSSLRPLQPAPRGGRTPPPPARGGLGYHRCSYSRSE